MLEKEVCSTSNSRVVSHPSTKPSCGLKNKMVYTIPSKHQGAQLIISFCLLHCISTKIEKNVLVKKSLQHQQFPGGLPSQYYVGPTLLNFSFQMGTGAFNVVWPQTVINENKQIFMSL